MESVGAVHYFSEMLALATWETELHVFRYVRNSLVPLKNWSDGRAF